MRLLILDGIAGAVRSATTRKFQEESGQHVEIETKGKGMSTGNILPLR